MRVGFVAFGKGLV
jgi:hypothetical protein